MWVEKEAVRDAGGTPEKEKAETIKNMFQFTVINHKIFNPSDLREQCAGPHPGLLHASDICWADVV